MICVWGEGALSIKEGSLARLCKFKKIFNSSVQIMLTMMRINYSLLFSYSHNCHFKEGEILLCARYFIKSHHVKVAVYLCYSISLTKVKVFL
jgi:hypothetical protein